MKPYATTPADAVVHSHIRAHGPQSLADLMRAKMSTEPSFLYKIVRRLTLAGYLARGPKTAMKANKRRDATWISTALVLPPATRREGGHKGPPRIGRALAGYPQVINGGPGPEFVAPCSMAGLFMQIGVRT